MSILAGLTLALQGLAARTARTAKPIPGNDPGEAAHDALWAVARRLKTENARLRVQLAEAIEHIEETERVLRQAHDEAARLTEERAIWRAQCQRQEHALMVSARERRQVCAQMQAAASVSPAGLQGAYQGPCNCVPARHDRLAPRR